MLKRTFTGLLVMIFSHMLVSNGAAADGSSPQEQALVPMDVPGVSSVYARPGATLANYSSVILAESHVAFRKNWDRDHNRGASLRNRVDARDMERIRAEIAALFQEVFSEELASSGLQLVNEPGELTMLIRPAILDLDITAPDTQSPGRSRTFVESAGSMTLKLEIYDAATGDLIVTVLDSRSSARSSGRGRFAFEANRMTNRAEAERMLRGWAGQLSDHLVAARAANNTAAVR